MTMFALVAFSLGLSAQKNIEAMIKKCETSPSVNMEVIKKKNPDGKSQDVKMVSIRINSDKELVNDFLQAFKKDETDADDVITKKEKGKEVSMILKFSDTRYSIRIQDDKNARVSVNDNPNSFSVFNWDRTDFNLDNLDIDWPEQSTKWGSLLKEHQGTIDSLVKISAEIMKSINWDSVSAEIDNSAEKMKSINWDSVAAEIDNSVEKVKSINWDSVRSEFGIGMDTIIIINNVDSSVNKIKWNKVDE